MVLRWFEHAKMLIEGAVIFFQRVVHEKAGGHRFFSVPILGSQLEIKRLFNDMSTPPHANFPRYAQWG